MKKKMFQIIALILLPTMVFAQGTGTSTPVFSILNWVIVAIFLIGTTYLGEKLKGSGKGLEGFFRGGKSIPWWAVSLSLIATKTSVSTFIAVPAFVYSLTGDLTYLQMTLGFMLGNFLFVFVLLKEYYQDNVYSPYDFIQNRLGMKISQLARYFFMTGATLSQGVRLLGTALVLSVVTGLETIHCIGIIALFAVIWSYIGGITTVIWTAAIQYLIFTIGALFALFYAIGDVSGGIMEIIAIADAKAKLVLFDLSFDPHKTYTLWVGILGCTFFEFGSDAVDQVVTQQALCCKNLREARKAIAFSAIGVMTTYIMAFVGLALVAYYHLNPLSPEMTAVISAEPDKIFPYFVMTQIPNGISGIIIAAMFAAGISTLDSALAALSQTSIMGIGPQLFPKMKTYTEQKTVFLSKIGIIVWGFILAVLAYGFSRFQAEGLLALGFKMPGFVYGILIGIAFLSLMRKGRFGAILTGAIISVITMVFFNIEGISFFWWFPAGAIIVITISLIDHYLFCNKAKL